MCVFCEINLLFRKFIHLYTYVFICVSSSTYEHIYLCTYTYVRLYICVHIRLSTHQGIHPSIYSTYLCTYILYMYIATSGLSSMYLPTYVCTLCVHISIYVSTYVYIYMLCRYISISVRIFNLRIYVPAYLSDTSIHLPNIHTYPFMPSAHYATIPWSQSKLSAKCL
jgi:hypothetical protein